MSDFSNSFSDFAYKHGQSNAFIDFLDYTLLAMKWWEPDRDFSYFEKKYGDLYPRFADMLISLSEISDNRGEGFGDGLGDLFMELVSGGRNGQFFTPENICEMMSEMIIPEVEDNKSVLDPSCGSGRMLLAAAKRNRNAFFFGCDNDITCCKMAVINLVLNTLQGEIALMDSLNMDYTKSWEVSYRVYNGINMPVYRVVENKEDSTLWKMHMKSFNHQDAELPKEAVPAELVMSVPEPPVIIPSWRKSSNKQSNALQLELF
ncbi:MAG: N-6 DNA methylase [Tannerellaceae bacterium]